MAARKTITTDEREEGLIREVAAGHVGPPSEHPEEASGDGEVLGFYAQSVAELGFDPQAPR